MTLLERLKDIVPVRTRPGESHEQKMRREIAEDALMLKSLPLLLELAEAVGGYRKAEQGLVKLSAEIMEGVTRPRIEFHADCRKANLMVRQTRERLDAVLAKLEGGAE